jgi:branched-chain amino acid transport system ATP-binding protein
MPGGEHRPLLQMKNVCIQFGGLKVIENLNMHVKKAELLGLIGPNGAGKTTAFNLISGVYKPTAGQIFFEDERISDIATNEIAKRGVIRTFQNIRLFKELDVLTNILVAMHAHREYGLLGALIKSKSFRNFEDEYREEALALLRIFDLEKFANDESGSLPYGVQRKLEIVRALASHPKLLLLDEPAAGMNHSETHELMHLIERIREEYKLTVLLIEHDMKLVMGICERIIVLDHGVVIAEGGPNAIQSNPKVIEAYLGVEAT